MLFGAAVELDAAVGDTLAEDVGETAAAVLFACSAMVDGWESREWNVSVVAA